MRINKKWRLMVIPIILATIVWVGINIKKLNNETQCFKLKQIQKIGHETRYTLTPNLDYLSKEISINITIESNEHPENHAEPLEKRVLLTINNEEIITPKTIMKLSKDQYHLKGILKFKIKSEFRTIKTINLMIFDHEEHTFKWELNKKTSFKSIKNN